MDKVGLILPGVLHRRGLHAPARAQHVAFAAEKWLHGALPGIADALKVDTLAHAVLSISCVHGIAAQECMPLLPALKEYLGREFPRAVEEIRMVRAGGRKAA